MASISMASEPISQPISEPISEPIVVAVSTAPVPIFAAPRLAIPLPLGEMSETRLKRL